MNKIALITGASSGIGQALAECFARDKYNLVLVGRNIEALNAMALVFNEKYKINVVNIFADLSTQAGLKLIAEKLLENKVEVDVLVNNAGFGLWGKFAITDYEQESAMVHTHINAMLYLTKLVLPHMLQQHSGKILNVGSVYSYSPVPLQSVYAATKTFMASYTAALRDELRDSGVTVSLLCPGTTLTNFRESLNKDHKLMFSMTAEQVANIAYAQLQKNKKLIIPGAINKLYVFIAKHLPVSAIKFVVYKVRGLKI